MYLPHFKNKCAFMMHGNLKQTNKKSRSNGRDQGEGNENSRKENLKQFSFSIKSVFTSL